MAVSQQDIVGAKPNQQFAQHYWPGQDPIGKRLQTVGDDKAWFQVVGLAKTSKYIFIAEAPTEFVYLPHRQKKYGLDSKSLLKLNPRLVHTTFTGYGMTGPDASRPGYDVTAFFGRGAVTDSMTEPGGVAHPARRTGRFATVKVHWLLKPTGVPALLVNCRRLVWIELRANWLGG